MINFADPKWRFEERVNRLGNRGHTKEVAEEMVKYVIETKEGPHGTEPTAHKLADTTS